MKYSNIEVHATELSIPTQPLKMVHDGSKVNGGDIHQF